MLGLVFEVAGERYAVEARRVVTVMPRPPMRGVPAAPPWIAGLYASASAWVPVVDVGRLIADVATPDEATSRLALVLRHGAGTTRTIGLLAPRITRVLELEAKKADGIFVPGREYLGPIVMSDSTGVQLLDVDRMIPPEVDALLFGAAAS